jgi:hypothetical protein
MHCLTKCVLSWEPDHRREDHLVAAALPFNEAAAWKRAKESLAFSTSLFLNQAFEIAEILFHSS